MRPCGLCLKESPIPGLLPLAREISDGLFVRLKGVWLKSYAPQDTNKLELTNGFADTLFPANRL